MRKKPSKKAADQPAQELETHASEPPARANIHPEKAPVFIDTIVQKYGDLIYDFCESVLWSSSNAQIVFRSVLKELKRGRSANDFEKHERAWVLRTAYRRICAFDRRHGKRLSAAERIMLDAALPPASRLKQFGSYFHRLTAEEKALLLLKHKYRLEYDEIATITATPPSSLRLRKQLAFRALEEWLWGVA